MNWVGIIFVFFGGLGFFFYGIRQFSEALQSLGGEIVRKIFKTVIRNRVFGVLVGVLVTCLVQSSSVSTVLVIGFVNAGLMQLTQAISVVFGANIGTTITGWIIAIQIDKYGIHMVGIGTFPLLFTKDVRWQNFGRIIFGLGLVFIGLETMGEAFRPLRHYPPFLDALVYFEANSLFSVLVCVAVGCFLTMIMQSSSVMLGITIALASTGAIAFETAAALVLGENIGTTITAILSSVGTNTDSKRVAAAHAFFNVVGVCLMVLVFRPYIQFVEWLIPKEANFIDAAGARPFVATHIAAAHSVFNISSTLLFLPFLKQIARFVSFIVPDPEYKEQQKLEFLGEPDLMPPVLAIAQAYAETHKLAVLVKKQFVFARDYILSANGDKALREKVIKYEDISDNIQKEIMVFVCRLMERNLTANQALQINCMLSIVDDLESVADYCRSLVEYRYRLHEDHFDLNDETIAELSELSDGVLKLLELILMQMSEPAGFQQGRFEGLFRQMKELGEQIKRSHLERIKNGLYSPLSGLTFSDIIVAMRKMMGHISAVNRVLNTMPF